MKKIHLMASLLLSSSLACPFSHSLPTSNTNDKASTAKEINSNRDQDFGIVTFIPPAGWQYADAKALPPRVKLMVVGKGEHPFPPSMNLSTEPYQSTLKDYLKIVKAMNDNQGYEWKDLGMIRTEAGNASLSQVDTKSEWGKVRLMHAILLKNGRIYILTASALKEEFGKFYKEFFAAMRSLRVDNDVFDMVTSNKKRAELKTLTQQLKNNWHNLLVKKQQENTTSSLDALKQNLFADESFQNQFWNPFKATIQQKFSDMAIEWQNLFINTIEDELFNITLKDRK